MGVCARFSLLLCLWASIGLGAQVRTLSQDKFVFVTEHPANGPWKLNEAACVFRQGQRLACGYVEERSEVAARIVVTASSGSIALGDTVERMEYTSNLFAIDPTRGALLVTHEANRRWNIGDTACLARQNIPFACGIIRAADDLRAELRLYEKRDVAPAIGDEVRRTGARVNVLAAEDEAIAVAQPIGHLWKEGQPVAVFRDGKGIAIGSVVRSIDTSARVQLLMAVAAPALGDQVLPVSTAPDAPPARAESKATAPKPTVGPTLVALGLFSLGNNLRFLRLERRLGRRYHVGNLTYLLATDRGDGVLRGYGSFATITVLPFDGILYGLGFQIGMGFLHQELDNLVTVVRSTSFAMFGSAVWRISWESGFNFGVGFGSLYALGANPALPKFFPHGSVEFGVHF